MSADTIHSMQPNPEPAREPFDPHQGPLDNLDDARFLDPADPRRLAAERDRGRPFNTGETHEFDTLAMEDE